MNRNSTDENESNELLILQKKAGAFLTSGNLVHIPYKKGYWKRGTILEVNDDYFMLEERMEGKQPVFFFEIEDIQVFTPKEAAK